MSELVNAYNERLSEVEAYLDLLTVLEEQARKGPPKIEGALHPITTKQQKILYSGVYLQLYNLVESTMTRCIESISEAAAQSGAWSPGDLCGSLREEWVRYIARTHVELSPTNRLSAALALCSHLISALPINEFSIEKGGGGNWDDDAIESISARLGFQLVVSQAVYKAIKRPVKNDLGPLGLVKLLRNQLAHGGISFEQCSEGVTVQELRDVKVKVSEYLREVVNRFAQYVEQFEFLVPEKRPV